MSDDWPDGEDEFSLRKLESGDPHYVAIGRVAHASSVLETLLDTTITDLLRADAEAAQCLIAQFIGPERRVKAMVALARLRGAGEDLVKKLNQFGGRCSDVGTRRNRVIHDVVVVSTKTGRTFRASGTADRKLDYGWRETSDKIMQDLALEIETLTEKGTELYAHLIETVGTIEQIDFLRLHGILPLSLARA
jgi:hypothetical protein